MEEEKVKLLLFLTLLVLTVLLLNLSVHTEVRRMGMVVNVTHSRVIGISVESKLDFGKLPPGISSTKVVEMNNSTPFRVRFKLSVDGNISKLTRIEPTDFVLESNGSRKVTVKVTATNATGMYTGNLIVSINRPTNKFFEWVVWIQNS